MPGGYSQWPTGAPEYIIQGLENLIQAAVQINIVQSQPWVAGTGGGTVTRSEYPLQVQRPEKLHKKQLLELHQQQLTQKY